MCAPFTHAGSQQQPNAVKHVDPKPRTNDTLGRELLVKSYLQSKEFVPEERIIYLAMASRIASRIDPGLGREWSEELFTLSLQTPPSWNRVAAQKNAIVSLSAFDPDRAMELLAKMDTELPIKGGPPPEDLHADAARAIFAALWGKKGITVLADIRARAQQIGDHGEYPYTAMQPVIINVSKQDPLMAQTLFSEAVSYYKRGSVVRSSDRDFVSFLIGTQAVIRPALLQEAISAVLDKSKQSSSKEEEQYLTRVRTDKGVAEFHSEFDELIFELLPLMRRVDPSAESKVLREHAALVQVANQAGTVEFQESVAVKGAALEGNVHAAQSGGIQRSRLAGIQQLANQDPSKALELTLDISDPGVRAIALGDVAAGFGAHDAERAARLLSQAKDIVTKLNDDSPLKTSALASLANGAAACHDSSLFKDAFQQLLKLGEEEFEEDADANPSKTAILLAGFPAMSRATEAGAKFDAQVTLNVLNGLRDERLQTYLLVAAVEGLQRQLPNQAAAK